MPRARQENANTSRWPTSRTLAELDSQTMEFVQERFESPGRVGPTTGLLDLDKIVGLLQPGSLVVVQGPTAAGKSALLISAALANGRQRTRTVMISNRDPHSELGLRLLAARSDVDVDRLRDGRLLGHDWETIARAMATDLPLQLISTRGPLFPRTIRRALRSHPGLVLVDDATPGPISSILHVARMSSMDPLAAIVRSAPCPIFASVEEGRAEWLTEMADVVVAVGPEQLPSIRGVSEVVRLTVTKHRVGPTGSVNAIIRRPGGLLVDVADESRVGESSISTDLCTD